MSATVPRYISITAALALLAQSATALVAPAATAADMLDGPVQETTQVEYGTGWYLRGDISLTAHKDYFSSETSEANAIGDSQNVQTSESDTAFTFGIGAGYNFTNNIRGDIGYRYLGSGERTATATGVTPTKPCEDTFILRTQTDSFGNETTILTGGQTIENCTEQSESSYDLQAMMANVYYDIDTPLWGMKPFVGAGVGLIRNQFTSIVGSITCTPNSFEQCNPTDGGAPDIGEEYIEEGDRTNGTSYHLAGALHAGVAIPIGNDMYFDTSYTYTRMIEDATFGGTDGVDESGAPTDFHSLRLGLRIEIW